MSKERGSKLDKFAKQIEQWLTPKKLGGDGITLGQAAARLSELRCSVSPSTLWDWWEKFQLEKREAQLLDKIVTGGNQIGQVEAALKKNPAPEMDTLLKLYRVLILQLTTKGQTAPELLCLADRLTNTFLQFISGETKAKFKEREVTLAEQKAAESKKDNQTKALEYCLEEAKPYPAVQEKFRDAFAALKKAKAK